jgi:hypothetical protein
MLGMLREGVLALFNIITYWISPRPVLVNSRGKMGREESCAAVL